MSSAHQKSISKYLDVPQHELQLAETRGVTDADLNALDTTQKEFNGYTQELMSSARGAWANYESEHTNRYDELQSSKSSDEFQVKSGIPQEIGNLEEAKRAEEELFQSKEGRNSSEYEKIDEDLRIAKSDYEKIRAELNRPLLTKFEKVYLPFLVLLSFAEVPINRQAFELFFSESPAVILVLALAVGIMLVFFAHTVGHLIRENSSREDTSGVPVGPILGGLSVLSVTAILMYFLAVMRQSYANLSKGASTFDDLFADGGIALDVIQDSLFQPLSSEGVSLLVLNFSIFFAGILASYFRHDPHPNYEKIVRTHDKLRNKMVIKKERIESALNKIQSKHNKKIDSLSNRRKNLLENIDRYSEELRNLQEQKNSDFNTMVANLNYLVASYEKGYRSSSSKSKLPKFFAKSYIQKIKLELTR